MLGTARQRAELDQCVVKQKSSRTKRKTFSPVLLECDDAERQEVSEDTHVRPCVCKIGLGGLLEVCLCKHMHRKPPVRRSRQGRWKERFLSLAFRERKL